MNGILQQSETLINNNNLTKLETTQTYIGMNSRSSGIGSVTPLNVVNDVKWMEREYDSPNRFSVIWEIDTAQRPRYLNKPIVKTSIYISWNHVYLICCSAAIPNKKNPDTFQDVKTNEYYILTLTCIANNLLSVIWSVQQLKLKQRWSTTLTMSVK